MQVMQYIVYHAWTVTVIGVSIVFDVMFIVLSMFYK